MCITIILLYSRVWCNIVNWLYFSKKYVNTHAHKTLSFYYLTHLWVRNPGCSVTQLGSLLISHKTGMRLLGGLCLFLWGWIHFQTHSGSSLSSVSWSLGTEATLSLQAVDQGPALAARVLVAFLHMLFCFAYVSSFHPQQQQIMSLLYFRFLWHQWEKLLRL